MTKRTILLFAALCATALAQQQRVPFQETVQPAGTPSPGNGICWFDSTAHAFECLNSFGTVTVIGAGGGNNTYCPDATGSTTTYSCPSPTPAVTTLTGLMVAFVPQTTNTGTSTLNVAALGAKTLKQADGSTNIPSGALVGGTAYAFSYDGTNFRQVSSSGGGTGNAASVVTATFSATPTFTCPSATADTVTLFHLSTALTANITSSTLATCTPGQTIIMDFQQDGTGGRTVALPTGFPAVKVNPTPNSHTVFAFSWNGSTAITPGSDLQPALLTTPVLFSALPAASLVSGAIATVSDSTTASQGATVTGGGSNNVVIYSNGTNWIVVSGAGGGGGGVSYCAPASASGTTYTCAPSPALTAYSAGSTLAFVPDVNGSGGATTVNVNALGAKSVKRSDGTTNPTAIDFVAGQVYVLTYDGTVFREAPNGTSSGSCPAGVWNMDACEVKTTILSSNAAFQAASASALVTLFTLPASSMITGVVVKHSTQFTQSGGSVTTLTAAVTNAGASDYSFPFEVFSQAVASTVFYSDGGLFSKDTASQTVKANFVGNANLGNGAATFLTAGSVTIWVRYITLL